jgi:hypothetical protein
MRNCMIYAGLMACMVSAAASSALASIDVEFRPASQIVNVGDVVDVGVYLVSDSTINQTFSTADIVFEWDATYLDLLGFDSAGAVGLLSGGFTAGDVWGINEASPPQDGDGLFQGFAPLGSPIDAVPAGSLLTTFRFTALAETPATNVLLLTAAGSPSKGTTIFGGTGPNEDVTGNLSGAVIEIVPEPASCFVVVGALLLLRRRI